MTKVPLVSIVLTHFVVGMLSFLYSYWMLSMLLSLKVGQGLQMLTFGWLRTHSPGLVHNVGTRFVEDSYRHTHMAVIALFSWLFLSLKIGQGVYTHTLRWLRTYCQEIVSMVHTHFVVDMHIRLSFLFFTECYWCFSHSWLDRGCRCLLLDD